MKQLATSLSVASLLAARAAMAQPPPAEPPPPPAVPMEPAPAAPAPMMGGGSETFGSAGQIAVDANLAATIAYTSSKPPMGDSEGTTTIALQPAMMYFIADNIAVGGLVKFTWVDGDSGSITSLRIAPAFGYHLALSPAMSLFPRVFLGYTNLLSAKVKMGGMEADGPTAYSIDIGIDVPILFHMAPHFFIGAGPSFSYDLVSQFDFMGTSGDANKALNIGLLLQIGGWF